MIVDRWHEYVTCAARSAGIGFRKEGNCFTESGDPERLAQIADTFSHPGGIGRLSQVIDRWIYSACLCYGLNLDEQEPTGSTSTSKSKAAFATTTRSTRSSTAGTWCSPPAR